MESRCVPQRVRGFSLFELIIVMGIVGILMAIAIPSYRFVTSSNRVAGEINGLVGDLQFARAEAIKEGQTVTVCIANAAGTGCVASGTTTWQSGWIVFSDIGNDQTVDAGDPILRIQSAFTGADTFTSNNSISAITFNREGFASANGSGLNGGTAAMLTLHTTPVSNASTRCLSLTSIGVMTLQPFGGACT